MSRSCRLSCRECLSEALVSDHLDLFRRIFSAVCVEAYMYLVLLPYGVVCDRTFTLDLSIFRYIRFRGILGLSPAEELISFLDRNLIRICIIVFIVKLIPVIRISRFRYIPLLRSEERV